MKYTYQQAIDYLYARLPMFQRQGKAAVKKGLDNIIKLCEALGNPHLKYPVIHVAGTNGKGSSCHSLAAILQAAGYKTGLYTSPHLKDFTERKRVNGQPAPQEWVADFVSQHQALIEEVDPSFFELSVAMAFQYLAEQQADVAVIEVGLGGRLDSTNIVHPLVCLITNISYDHMDLLGETLPSIAGEKAGIIKPNVPVVIGTKHPETAPVFIAKAQQEGAPITFANDVYRADKVASTGWVDSYNIYDHNNRLVHTWLPFSLVGNYQQNNLPGILAVIDQLREQGFAIANDHVKEGLGHVQQLTGLKGRWQVLSTNPLLITDVAHNEAGLSEVFAQLKAVSQGRPLRIVLGVMRDKDLNKMLPLLPWNARYYCCAPDTPRALPAADLCHRLKEMGLEASDYGPVPAAVEALRRDLQVHEVGFIGGSTFVVAEVPNL